MLFKQAVLVIGAGSWGTALALVLAKNGHHVLLWSRNSDHVHQMQTSRQNARFLADIRFPVNLQPIASLETWIPQIQDIIIVVPSQGFREILHKIVPHLTETARLCWATKGLEYQSGLLLHQVAEQVVGTHHPLAVLTGPSFAKEVAMGLPTAVTVASFTEDHAQAIVALFHNNNFRPYTTLDLVGAQLGGAVKNIIAIAAGVADGLGFGANTRSALITRGLSEMVRFGVALGGQQDTFMGLAGLGDLVLTCTDNQSRNRRFGYALAQGHPFQQALTKVGQVVEGIHATYEINRLAQQHQIEMPITAQVYRILQEECTPKEAVQALLSRALKSENSA